MAWRIDALRLRSTLKKVESHFGICDRFGNRDLVLTISPPSMTTNRLQMINPYE